ncbi:hypothetical protein AWN90_23345 [Nocardia terpenica]|uniref:Uncharacterized protein n=1 Tax=Nocardia terpenica TaxID=455432 RepID=A0A161WDB8_9NOCA|nr:hypothetical protein AWN90_23345 [Nocardia terpenica]
MAIAQNDVESDDAPGVAGVSVHQRRADLLTRLDEVVWIHTALRTCADPGTSRIRHRRPAQRPMLTPDVFRSVTQRGSR